MKGVKRVAPVGKKPPAKKTLSSSKSSSKSRPTLSEEFIHDSNDSDAAESSSNLRPDKSTQSKQKHVLKASKRAPGISQQPTTTGFHRPPVGSPSRSQSEAGGIDANVQSSSAPNSDGEEFGSKASNKEHEPEPESEQEEDSRLPSSSEAATQNKKHSVVSRKAANTQNGTRKNLKSPKKTTATQATAPVTSRKPKNSGFVEDEVPPAFIRPDRSLKDRPVVPFKPPRGFSLNTIDSKSVSLASNLFQRSTLKEKQIWHITAPPEIPITSIKEVALDRVTKGEPVLSHDRSGYGFISGDNHELDDLVLLIPNEEGYSRIPTSVDKKLQLQKLVKAPDIDPVIALSTSKSARRQPKGLRMRHNPSSFGADEPAVIGSSESEDEETGIPRVPVSSAQESARSSVKRKREVTERSEEDPERQAKKARKEERRRKREEKERKEKNAKSVVPSGAEKSSAEGAITAEQKPTDKQKSNRPTDTAESITMNGAPNGIADGETKKEKHKKHKKHKTGESKTVKRTT